MNTDELERILEVAEETDALDFKGAMLWNAHALVKDILAMTNVRDGGRLVIGVEDGTWNRQGLTPEQVASYDIDIMRDQVSPYADPVVIFRVDLVDDLAGRTFAVITVSPFEELPVICKKDGPDVRAGAFYFRTRTRRPQSAPISNSAELRQILLRAATNVHRNLEDHGYQLNIQANVIADVVARERALDAELGGL